MNKKMLSLALVASLASTGAVAQQSHPDAAELAEPASPVQSLLGSVGAGAAQDKGKSVSDKVQNDSAATGEAKSVAVQTNPDVSSTKPAAAKPVKVAAAPAPAPVPAVPAAPEPAPVVESAEPLLVAEPALLPQAAAARPVNKVRLTPSERNFLSREEYLLRQIRLLELENQAAELSRKLEGPQAGLPMPQLDSASLSAMASLDEPANAAPPFRLISVWGQGGSYRADVLVNGIRLSVSKGEELGDGWRVVDITRNALQIQRGSERVTMKLGS